MVSAAHGGDPLAPAPPASTRYWAVPGDEEVADPVRATVTGELVPECVMVSVAALDPELVGAKVTGTPAVPPGGMDTGVEKVVENCPASAPEKPSEETVSALPPGAAWLVRVSDWLVEVPTTVGANVRLDGLTPREGLVVRWMTSIARTSGFSTTWPKSTSSDESVGVAVKVLTIALFAPTAAKMSKSSRTRSPSTLTSKTRAPTAWVPA